MTAGTHSYGPLQTVITLNCYRCALSSEGTWRLPGPRGIFLLSSNIQLTKKKQRGKHIGRKTGRDELIGATSSWICWDCGCFISLQRLITHMTRMVLWPCTLVSQGDLLKPLPAVTSVKIIHGLEVPVQKPFNKSQGVPQNGDCYILVILGGCLRPTPLIPWTAIGLLLVVQSTEPGAVRITGISENLRNP